MMIGLHASAGARTVPTAAAFGPAVVTIRATNPGGAADVSFTVAILAAEPKPEGDNVIRFDTIARRFDSTTARFDGFVPDAAPAGGFDSALLRFDMTGVRFDGAQFAPALGAARFDSAELRFDRADIRFDGVPDADIGGAVPERAAFPDTYDEAA